MKTMFITLKKYPSAQSFLLFSILFYLSMYVSKTVHALWFAQHNSLELFGFSYTIMSITGALSFFTGKISDKLPPDRAMRIAVLLYAIGLMLRIFTNSYIIAGISGFVAGIGASLIVVSMRHWILNIGEEENRASIVALKETGVNIGTTLGAALAGVLVTLIGFYTNQPIFIILLLSAVLCSLTMFFVPKLVKEHKNGENKLPDSIDKKYKIPKSLSGGVIFFGVIAGLSVSLLIPFIPVILKSQGVSVSLIGFFIAITSLAAIIFSPIFSSEKINKNKQKIFFFGELLAGLLLLCFLTKISIFLIPFILIARTFFQTASIITQELMELEMYPKIVLGTLFGLSQSAFFVGDALGGSIGGFLFSWNQNYAIIICSLIILFNAVVFPLFFKVITTKEKMKQEKANVLSF